MSGMVTHGADVEALDDIAVVLRRQGSKIADVGGRGAAHLEKLRALWDGPDFEKFAKEWRAAHRAIDDAELALRNYSRKLVAEADQQRASSRFMSGEVDGGQGSGSAFERVDHAMAFEPVEEGPAFERVDHAMAFEPVEEGPAFERVDHAMAFEPVEEGPAVERVEHAMAFERVDEAATGAPVRVEPLPDGLTGLALDGTHGPVLLQSPHGMLITDNHMALLPDLPGTEDIVPGRAEPAAFERMDASGGSDAASGEAFEQSSGVESAEQVSPAGEPSGPSGASGGAEGPAFAQEAPAQVPEAPAQAQEALQLPSGDGGHITTADDAAGQRSVAFDPRGVVDQADWADSSDVGGWLGLDGLVLLPWNRD